MYRLSKKAPQFGVGDRVEVFLGGGLTRPGTVTGVRRMNYVNGGKGWQYQVQLDGKPYKFWYGPMDVFDMQQTLQLGANRQANWVEKSRDMYHIEQKPVGHDRKSHEGPFPTNNDYKDTWLEIRGTKPPGKLRPKYLEGDQVYYKPNWGGKVVPARILRYEWSPEHGQFYYSIEVEGHYVVALENSIIPPQGRLFATKSAAQVQPQFSVGENVIVQYMGNTQKGIIKAVHRDPVQGWQYSVSLPITQGTGVSGWQTPPYRWMEQNVRRASEEKKMKITAAEVLPFDPSKRKLKSPAPKIKSIPFPAEFAPDQNEEDKEALYYAYDNAINDLRGLFNIASELGEQETAMNIQAAIDVLTGANRKP